MLRKSVVFGLSALMMAAAQPALAVNDQDMKFHTTENLYHICNTPSSAAEYVAASFACRGFIEGAVQYHDAVSDRKHLKRLICYPKTATVEDGRLAFLAWVQKNQKNRKLMSEMPVVGLVRALAEKYPCD